MRGIYIFRRCFQMEKGFSIEKWELNRAILEVISEYAKVKYQEKEIRWFLSNHLEDVKEILICKKDKDKRDKLLEVLNSLPETDFIFVTKPESIFKKLYFVQPPEYIQIVFKNFEESRKELTELLKNFKTALRVVSKAEESIPCTSKFYLTVIFAILQGIITKEDAGLLKTVEVPKSRKNNFRRLEEGLNGGKRDIILSLLWIEEMNTRVTL